MLDLHPPFSKQIEAGTALPEGGRGVTPPPPTIIQTLVKVGPNGTGICSKLVKMELIFA